MIEMKRSSWTLIIFFGCLCLSAAQTTPRTENGGMGLMVTTPSSWVAGTDETVCIVPQVEGPPLKATLTVTKLTGETLSDTKLTAQSGQSSCVDIFVSTDWAVDSVQLQVTAVHESGSYSFNRTGTVKINRNNLMIFVQTDKPVYKPSDLVRIRVLAVSGQDLKPVSDQITSAYIEDPAKTRLMQWTDVDTSHGLGSLEMPLSSEPPLGTWTVTVVIRDQQKSLSFDVKEYVLPKYSIQIIADPEVYLGATRVEWKVCATYTFGEPVSGEVSTNICKFVYWDRSNKQCIHHNRTVLTNGCAKFVAEVSQLLTPGQNIRYMDGTPLELYAEVEEKGTGIKFNTTSSSKFVRKQISVDLSESPTFYKPGMIYLGKGIVKGTDVHQWLVRR